MVFKGIPKRQSKVESKHVKHIGRSRKLDMTRTTDNFRALQLCLPLAAVIASLSISIVNAADQIPIPTGYTPVPCQVPNFPETYFLVEGLSADYNQDTYSLYVSDVAVPTGPVSPSGLSLQPMCIDVSKAMNLYQGADLILMYSNYVGGTGFPSIKVMSICGDDIAFTIHLAENFEYKIDRQDGSCMAIGRNTISSVVEIVDCSTKSILLASGRKHFEDKPITIGTQSYPAMAYWNASTNSTAAAFANLSPSALPFLMAIKDNEPMDCTPTPQPGSGPSPAPPSNSGLSSLATIIIAVLLSGFVALGVFALMRKYYKRSDYAEMRQAINDAHEA